MNKEDKNRAIIVLFIIGLLIAVIVTACILVVVNKKNDNKLHVIFKQLYVADGQIKYLVDDYFIINEDNLNDAIVDIKSSKKNSIPKPDFDYISTDVDGRYILYKKYDDKMSVYVFQNGNINFLYDVEFPNAEPLFYDNGSVKYILGFKVKDDKNIYIYLLNNEEPIVLKNIDEIYVNNLNYYVIKSKDNLYGIVNNSFEMVYNCLYKNIMVTDDNNFIMENTKNKYGLVDEKGELLLTYKYDYISKYGKYYSLVLNKKMALYDKDLNTIIDYEINYLIDDKLILYELGDNIIINVSHDDSVNKQDYMYVINNKKIIDSVLINNCYYDNGVVVYTYGKSFVLFDGVDKKIIKYSDNLKKIKVITDNLYMFTFVSDEGEEYIKYYDKNLDIVQLNYKNLVYNRNNVLGFLEDDSKGVKFIVIDYDYNVLKEIRGNLISINNDYLIVDNELYEISVK